MASSDWSYEDVPSLAGCMIIVTGANSGIGLEATKELVAHGAHVVMACRSMERAEAAQQDVAAFTPNGQTTLMQLDLGDLASVRRFANAYLERFDRLDRLINNAGVMAIPRRETADGFEMQFGVNHLGHFALTGLLVGRILETPDSRIVCVSSNAHKMGKMRFGDLQWERSYSKWGAYGQAKLANLLFVRELQRRLDKTHADTISVGCHPGWAATNLQLRGPEMEGASVMRKLNVLGNKLIAQSPKAGAMPTVFATTEPTLRGGEYIGPSGFMEVKGAPKRVEPSKRARDEQVARKLWEISEELTGVLFEI